jgi:hypothetical protein
MASAGQRWYKNSAVQLHLEPFKERVKNRKLNKRLKFQGMRLEAQ